MGDTPLNQPASTAAPLTDEYDDMDSKSDVTAAPSTGGVESVDGYVGPDDSDRMTISSYASSVDREFILKDMYGRVVNNTNEFYLMPADADEHNRLDIQHELLKVKLGALYWSTEHVRRILSPRPEGSEPPAVLDIGTGAGSWAIDMAEEFPHAEVVGLDLAPANTSRAAPPNCRFECDDVNQGLSHYKNAFDVVHMRCVDSGIEDGRTFYHELPDLLRPGGILLVVLGNFMHGQDRKIVTQEDENAPDFSWVAMLSRTYVKVAIERITKLLPDKGDRCGARSVYSYQEWMRETSAWEAQEHMKFLIPLGPWKPNLSGRERFAAEAVRKNFFKIVGAWRPALLTHGYAEDVVDNWIAKAREEMINMKPHTYVGFQASWALKQGVPNGDDVAMSED